MEGPEMKSCGGCDGSMSDRTESGTQGGKAEGLPSTPVDVVKSGGVLNPGSNPARTNP